MIRAEDVAEELEIATSIVEEVFIYLDFLADTGATNVLTAGSYIEDEFDLEPQEARSVMMKWYNECFVKGRSYS